MRNFLAVLIVWNLAFLMLLPRFTTSPGIPYDKHYFEFPLEEIHGTYIALFLLLLVVLFPLSLVINKMVKRLEVGKFFIKLGLYLPLCSTVWILFFPYLTFGNEMIIVVVSFAMIYELLGKLNQQTIKKLVKAALAVSFVVASVFYFGFSL
ncbi:hypothetical protein VKA52_13705 [Halobacillus sp. HZG1]|uniref:hypothetical protein n=1 Tax=Halobacillus sp. HZG1 TaxID=3111769 RepID=UPI002DBB787C|nr:hypothetical protein [Halobacillus sp. HZG1]MEC3884784.1 hypothetical protein [Halobacillus sp. HZG1]